MAQPAALVDLDSIGDLPRIEAGEETLIIRGPGPGPEASGKEPGCQASPRRRAGRGSGRERRELRLGIGNRPREGPIVGATDHAARLGGHGHDRLIRHEGTESTKKWAGQEWDSPAAVIAERIDTTIRRAQAAG